MKNIIRRGLWVAATLSFAASSLAQEAEEPKDDPRAQNATPQAIPLDALQDAPGKYTGQMVKVSGEVADVLGPRLFTMDAGKWLDFRGDMLVITPAPLAALVAENTPIAVTGTVRPIVEADIAREWGWFEDNPTIKAELQQRPGLVAQSITDIKSGGELALKIEMGADDTSPQPGLAEPKAAAVTDLDQLARSTDQGMVGQRVDVRNATVAGVANDGGFWVSIGEDRLFVLPVTPSVKVTPGQTVGLEGVVLALPEKMKDRLGDGASGEEIYVYAHRIEQVT